MATREELENLLNQDISIMEIYRVSHTTIGRWISKLGIERDKRKSPPKMEHKKCYCANCNGLFEVKSSITECCSKECSAELKSKRHYEEYLLDNSVAYGQKNMQGYKKWFIKDQNHKCAICNMEDVWQEKPLVFILDHINGNAADNTRTNLRLVCPNCDSQLDTYKAKNKNSARAEYR